MRWLFMALALLTACEKTAMEESPRPVKAIQVSKTSIESNPIIFPGTLRALGRADLSFRVDGIVVMRDITVGYKAEKGAALIQLDPREYEIAVQKAKGNVESIQAQLDFAGRDLIRMQRIYDRDPGAISVSLLDKKRETNNRLKADLTVAQGDLDKALDDLSYTTLKAPFDGIIAAIYVENHEQVRAKQPVLRFLDTVEREMEIHIPERLINFILAGKGEFHFEVRLDAFPDQVFSAFIKEIGTEASSTTQTYPVTLRLQGVPDELSLLAGMSGRAILQPSNESLSHVFIIPKSAIFTDNGHATYVWIVDAKTHTVHKQAVTLNGSQKGDNIPVEGGLNLGDWIVTAGTSFLTEGQRVRLLEPPNP